jgi:hypothetical protein
VSDAIAQSGARPKTSQGWLATLRAARRLDIFDIAYERSNEELGILNFGPHMQPRAGLITRLGSYCLWWGRHTAQWLRRRGAAIPQRAVVYFAGSKNEYDSLGPVCERMHNGAFIGRWGRARNNLNLSLVYACGLLFLPRVLALMLRSKGYRRASFRYTFDEYLIGYGAYCVGRMWFARRRPALFIVANHLATANRALLQAARDQSIPTVYFLHATISDIYPPLNTDYALLEGMDTLFKYDALGRTQAKVFLVGMAKHDRCAHRINASKRIGSLGLCINGVDPTPAVEELCQYIARSFPQLAVTLRPHPADRRTGQWAELASRLGFAYSDSRSEQAFDFLGQVDVNVAGESGIHLEAALCNVVPLYYDFEGKGHDLYGFRRNGLVEFAQDLESFGRFLDKLLAADKPQCRQRAKYYCATVETQWDWRSAQLAHAVLDRIEHGAPPDAGAWRRVQGVALEAYEPRSAQSGAPAESRLATAAERSSP